MNFIINNYSHTIFGFISLDNAIKQCFIDLKITYRCVNRHCSYIEPVSTHKILSELLNTHSTVASLTEDEKTEIVNTCQLMNTYRK